MEVLKIEGYKELTMHSLRHTACSIGIMNGVRVEEMKEVLGHSNIGVSDSWYTHLDERSRIEASRKLSNKMTEILESKV